MGHCPSPQDGPRAESEPTPTLPQGLHETLVEGNEEDGWENGHAPTGTRRRKAVPLASEEIPEQRPRPPGARRSGHLSSWTA